MLSKLEAAMKWAAVWSPISIAPLLPGHLQWIPVAAALPALLLRLRVEFAKANADAAEHNVRKEAADLARGALATLRKGADKRP